MYPSVSLRQSIESDLHTFFANQLDKDINYLVAFTAENPNDKEAYFTKWKKNMADSTTNMQTILQGDQIAGSVFTYEMMGETQISYWLGKTFWGKGIATYALRLFLKDIAKRPIFGRTAFDNLPSQKVLLKCGFIHSGKETGYSNARRKEIEEHVYVLNK